MNKNHIHIGNFDIYLRGEKLKYSVDSETRKRLCACYINVITEGKLIACKYDPYRRNIYLVDKIYNDNKDAIEKTLLTNNHAVVTREYMRTKENVEKWSAALIDMGIYEQECKSVVAFLEDGGLSYNNILDFHIRGCELTFVSTSELCVKCGEDTWKVVKVDGSYILYHNTYQVLPDGSRYIGSPHNYHIHREYDNLRGAMYAITRYSYDWHKLMKREGLVKSDRIIDLYIRAKTAVMKLYLGLKERHFSQSAG